MGSIPCSADGIDVYTVVSCARSPRAALSAFLPAFLTGLSPLTCLGATSDLERIFASKISLWAVPVTSLPGLLACRPWRAAFGLVWEPRHTDCWESSSRHQETRTAPCFSATISVNFHGFCLKRILLPRYFYQNANGF